MLNLINNIYIFLILLVIQSSVFLFLLFFPLILFYYKAVIKIVKSFILDTTNIIRILPLILINIGYFLFDKSTFTLEVMTAKNLIILYFENFKGIAFSLVNNEIIFIIHGICSSFVIFKLLKKNSV